MLRIFMMLIFMTLPLLSQAAEVFGLGCRIKLELLSFERTESLFPIQWDRTLNLPKHLKIGSGIVLGAWDDTLEVWDPKRGQVFIFRHARGNSGFLNPHSGEWLQAPVLNRRLSP